MPKPRYHIQVTQQDIDDAVRNNSYHCAVSSAIARQIDEAVHVLTDIQCIRFSLLADRKRLVYLTPRKVQEYVVAYDAGDKLEPFSFWLHHLAWEGPMQARVNGRTVDRADDDVDVAHISLGQRGDTRRAHTHRAPRMSPHGGIRRYGMRVMRVNQEPKAEA